MEVRRGEGGEEEPRGREVRRGGDRGWGMKESGGGEGENEGGVRKGRGRRKGGRGKGRKGEEG